jgi:N-acetylmuramoyl-L-alanine amidase
MGAPIWHPSPNFGPRRNDARPDLIVLHYTAMASATDARDWLCNPASQVSAHYLIAGDGLTWQMVAEPDRAWHAGAGHWDGHDDVNSRSIGIELSNTGFHPFSNPQMTVLEQLLGQIMARWAIPAAGVIGHSDMAPGRKIDPGPRFDWPRLARQKLARAAPAASFLRNAHTPDIGEFHALARHAGYTAPADTEILLQAIRARWAPWRRGPLCDADLTLVASLA